MLWRADISSSSLESLTGTLVAGHLGHLVRWANALDQGRSGLRLRGLVQSGDAVRFAVGEHVGGAVRLLSRLQLAGQHATANLAGQEVVRLSQTILCHLAVRTILGGELVSRLDKVVLGIGTGAQERQFKSIVLIRLLGIGTQEVCAGLNLASGQCLHTIVTYILDLLRCLRVVRGHDHGTLRSGHSMASRLLVNGAAGGGEARPLAHVVRKIGSSCGAGALELFLAVVLILISLALSLTSKGKRGGH